MSKRIEPARSARRGSRRLFTWAIIACPSVLLFVILSLAPTRAAPLPRALLAPTDPTPYPVPITHTAPLTTAISIQYNEPISPATVSTRTFAVHAMQTGLLTQTYAVGDSTIILTPTRPLKPGEWVQVSATTGTLSAIDSQGPVSPTVWQFRTQPEVAQGVLVDSGQSLGGASTWDVAFGDLDGDGDLDAFTAHYDEGAEPGLPNQVWWNQGGTFSDAGADLGSSKSEAVALGDLDGDGDLDVFVANLYQPNKVWFNQGGRQAGTPGTFADSGQNLGSAGSRDVALGDLDGDGDLDAYVGNWYDNKVWLNQGGRQAGTLGVFVDSGQSLGTTNTRAVALGDLDGDGDLDAFSANDVDNKVWLNGGLGVFTDNGQNLTGYSAFGMALGDLDNDGDLDAYVVNDANPDTLWLNDGGTFSESTLGTISTLSNAIALGDLDGDGDLDALVTYRNESNKIWLNDGAAAFTDSGQSLGSYDNHIAALGDLDGDGDLDVFFGNVHSQPDNVWANEDASGEPDIAVDPSSLGAILNPADAVTRTLAVGNTGSAHLIWSLAENPAVSWLDAAPGSGTLASGSRHEIAVAFDATGLPDGVYTTTLQIHSNDPDQAQVDVGVTLTITSDCIPPSQTDFEFAPLQPVLDEAVTFIGSVWAGTKPVAYTWDFGDGEIPEIGNPIAHNYANQGTFTVTLSARNTCGSDTTQGSLTVNTTAFGDYEPNDTCPTARSIPTNGDVQSHSFFQQADEDWVTFDAVAGTTYRIDAQVSSDSAADVALELYDQCGGDSVKDQSYDFSPEVRLEFEAPASGPLYLKLANEQASVFGSGVNYYLSVRALSDTPTPGALILVAGRFEDDDALQNNIHYVTDRVYKMFLAHGYTDSRITYLATDPNLLGYDDAATAANLQSAITSWAEGRVGIDRPLTLYMMDHGGYDKFYLDKPAGEWVTPGQLRDWLSQLEAAVPGLKVNVIVEACYSGSFIDLDQSLSGEDRVVVASTGAWNRAWASELGAVFSDRFVDELDQGASLYAAFQTANGAVQSAHPSQTPWLDDNGNGIANEPADGEEAALRGFAFAGTFAVTQWPPYIVQASGPVRVEDGRGVIQAQVLDDGTVEEVRAVIYAPSYQPPEPGEEMVSEEPPSVVLAPQGEGWYRVEYTGFGEAGAYRVVIYAIDDDGLEARPKVIAVNWRVFLPMVVKP